MKIDARLGKALAMLILALMVGISAGAIAWAAYLHITVIALVAVAAAVLAVSGLCWLERVERRDQNKRTR